MVKTISVEFKAEFNIYTGGAKARPQPRCFPPPPPPHSEIFWPSPVKVPFGLIMSEYHAKIVGNKVWGAQTFKTFSMWDPLTLRKMHHNSSPFDFWLCHSEVPFCTWPHH